MQMILLVASHNVAADGGTPQVVLRSPQFLYLQVEVVIGDLPSSFAKPLEPLRDAGSAASALVSCAGGPALNVVGTNSMFGLMAANCTAWRSIGCRVTHKSGCLS